MNRSSSGGTRENYTLEEIIFTWLIIFVTANSIVVERGSLTVGTVDPMPAVSGFIHPPSSTMSSYEHGSCSSSQNPPKRQRTEKIHQCKICGKVFGSGQALGGHMRAHRGDQASRVSRPNANDNNITSSVAYNNLMPVVVQVDDRSTVVDSVMNEPGQGSSGPPMDLDLNLLSEQQKAAWEDKADKD